eukprot:8581748-Ditylum_brightwellii.AAC.1
MTSNSNKPTFPTMPPSQAVPPSTSTMPQTSTNHIQPTQDTSNKTNKTFVRSATIPSFPLSQTYSITQQREQ